MLVALALAAVAAAGATSTGGGGEARFDFGDAPDGAPTGYPTGSVGAFPTRLRSDGARALVRDFHLGPLVDAEADAHERGQDFQNDGVILAQATSCGRGELAVLVTLERAAPAGGKTVFFNFWADWNLDGRWRGGDRCAQEHAVEDLPLTVQAGERVTIFRVRMRFGRYRTPFWSRSILSATPLRRATPTGEVGPGEVEDLPMPFSLPTQDVSCGTGFMSHGELGGAPITIAPRLFPLNFTQVFSRRPPFWTARLPAPDGTTPGPGLPRQPNPNQPRVGLIALSSLRPHVHRRLFPIEVLKVHGRVVPVRGEQRVFTCTFEVNHGAPVRDAVPRPPDEPSGETRSLRITVAGSYVHGRFRQGGRVFPSRLCLAFRTSPPASGSGLLVTVHRPSEEILFEGEVALDARGRAGRSFGIEDFGRYRIVASLGQASGTATVVVTSEPGGPCPSP